MVKGWVKRDNRIVHSCSFAQELSLQCDERLSVDDMIQQARKRYKTDEGDKENQYAYVGAEGFGGDWSYLSGEYSDTTKSGGCNKRGRTDEGFQEILPVNDDYWCNQDGVFSENFRVMSFESEGGESIESVVGSIWEHLEG